MLIGIGADRAGLNNALINTHHNAIFGAPCFQVLKICGNNVAPEQAFATADHYGKCTKSKFIHQISGKQQLDKFAASVNLQQRAILRFQARDFSGYIACYGYGVMPGKRFRA